jgi:competence protein ComEC
MLIDGGPSDTVLAELSDELGYFDRRIDVMLATHGDADHVTGLVPVLERYEVGKIIRSPIGADTGVFAELENRIRSEEAETFIGAQGDVLDFGDGVIVRVLYPSRNVPPRTDTNDASVSVVVTYGDHTFLLTGDLSLAYEPRLLAPSLPEDITVFKAGHHGSKTSSGETLLSYIKPEYAVISAGKDNRYGHPNEETLVRLWKYAKETLSTIDRGTITFESDGKNLEVGTGK